MHSVEHYVEYPYIYLTAKIRKIYETQCCTSKDKIRRGKGCYSQLLNVIHDKLYVLQSNIRPTIEQDGINLYNDYQIFNTIVFII